MSKIKIYRKNSISNPEIVEFKRRRSFWARFVNLRKLLFYVLLLVACYGMYLIMGQLKLSENLVLRKTEYVGLKRLQQQEMDRVIINEFGKSMFDVNIQDMQKLMKDNFIEVSQIKAEKIYPDKIVFQVQEKTARLILTNFNGKFLFDDNGEILKALCRDDLQKFDYFEYLMARGFGDPNADYVEDLVLENIGEEIELEEFNFATYPYQEKIKLLEELQDTWKLKFDNEIEYVAQNLDLNLDLAIPELVSWTEDCFEKGDVWDETTIDFAANSVGLFTGKLNLEIDNAKWDGDFRLFLNLRGGQTTVIVSPSRTLDIQIEDFESILAYSNKSVNDFRLIDLTSQKVLVE